MENKGHKSRMTLRVLTEATECWNGISWGSEIRFEDEDNRFSTSIFKPSRWFQKWTRGLIFCVIAISIGGRCTGKEIQPFGLRSIGNSQVASFPVQRVLLTHVCKGMKFKSTLSTFWNIIKSSNILPIQKASAQFGKHTICRLGKKQSNSGRAACYNWGRMQFRGNFCGVHKEGIAQPWINRNIYSN